MSPFSVQFFQDKIKNQEIDETIESSLRTAAQDPHLLYIFMQRYTHFNAYASAVIARLASSIGLSRYLFKNPELLAIEESDRGLEIAAQIMAAAADEGTDKKPVHRLLAQSLLKTIGNYANLSIEDRNHLAHSPQWLEHITSTLVENYAGTPGDLESLVKAMGFHVASEILGDREYALIDKVIRHEYKDMGFDKYLKTTAKSIRIGGHNYDPWCWVVIHGQHNGSAAECEHLICAINALNLAVRYCNQPQERLIEWVNSGFQSFVVVQQKLFYEIHRENLERIEQSTRLALPEHLPLASPC